MIAIVPAWARTRPRSNRAAVQRIIAADGRKLVTDLVPENLETYLGQIDRVLAMPDDQFASADHSNLLTAHGAITGHSLCAARALAQRIWQRMGTQEELQILRTLQNDVLSPKQRLLEEIGAAVQQQALRSFPGWLEPSGIKPFGEFLNDLTSAYGAFVKERVTSANRSVAYAFTRCRKTRG